MNYEIEFKQWLKDIGFADSAQSNYPIYVRKHIPESLSKVGINIKNLFFEDNLIKLNKYLEFYQKNGKLYQFNKDKKNFPSASLGKYIEFWGERKNILDKRDIVENKQYIKNIILYGSPGVGKTHNTSKLISTY